MITWLQIVKAVVALAVAATVVLLIHRASAKHAEGNNKSASKR